MHPSVSIARDLIAIPSVNPMSSGRTGSLYSERNIAQYVCEHLRKIGVDSQIAGAHVDHPNVVGVVNAGRQSSILLEAHMDTVTHEGMQIDPFDPVVKDGRLYGRGSCDTKASLAVYLSVLSHLLSSGRRLKWNVIVAGVHDEEFSFGGSRELVKTGLRPTFAVAGEPTSLNIIYAHKGVLRFKIRTEGKSAHAAMPWLGENAIYAMGDILGLLREYASALTSDRHPELGPATLNVGRITGGFAVNVVPSECEIEIDRRLLPGESYESVRDTILKLLKPLSHQITIEPPFLEAHGMYNNIESLSCQALLAACRRAGHDSQFETAHYGTDGSILAAAGIETVVFGPGSVDMAHTKAEYVPTDEIEQAHQIISHLLTEE